MTLERSREHRNALGKTVRVDTVATVIVVTLIALTFVVAALFVIGVVRGVDLMFG